MSANSDTPKSNTGSAGSSNSSNSSSSYNSSRQPAANKQFSRAVPTHLDKSGWLDYEQETALSVFKGLRKGLKRLSRKATAKRVHDARVNLRRFDAIWKVLKQDGWESKKFKRSIGNDLKEVRRMLGSLRDWDVNIELGRDLGLPGELIDPWQVERDMVAQHIEDELKGWDAEALLDDLKDHLKKRHKKLQKRAKLLGVDL
ncbi:MAG TPA: CHAD domain-containing protein, partial [Chroococcales cyanobacterium]